MTPMPMQAMSYAGYAPAFQPADARSWLMRGLIAVLVMVIIGGLALIFFPIAQPRPPLKQGRLSLISKPSGALIYLDGQPLLDANKQPLVTPVELKYLDYGAHYRVRLEMRDRSAAEKTFEMSERTDQSELSFVLEPMFGTIVASVSAEEASKVDVYFGNDHVGYGPTIKIDRPPGKIPVSARYQGRACVAEPESLDVVAGQTTVVTISCKRARQDRPVSAVAAARTEVMPSEERKREPSGQLQSPQSGPPGCTTNDALPPGYLTFDSSPYADVFVGSRKIGQTPIAKKEMASGCVILRAVNPDTGKEKTMKVEIKPGSVSIYSVEL
jgi:hypothetical protein